MRYSQLRAFHYVALHGGFSRAAAALNQTQPALSDQVRKLEQAHDTLLFHREGRQVRLTETGEDLFRMTRAYFDQEDQIGSFLDRSRAAVTGTLRIVADSATHITAALGRFRVAHPEVFVTIRSGNTADVVQALRAFEAEVGVVGNQPPAPEFDLIALGQSAVVAVAAHGVLPHEQPLALADLNRWPLVFREAGSRTRATLEAAAKNAGVTLHPAIEVEGREAMREVVASGAGIGFVSEAEFGNDSRLVRVPVDGLDASMVETLVTLRARSDVPAIRAFRKILE